MNIDDIDDIDENCLELLNTSRFAAQSMKRDLESFVYTLHAS